MRLASLILPLCLLASCRKEEPAPVRVPSSLRLDHFGLPVASFSKDGLSTADAGYLEAVVDGDTVGIHHPNGHLSSTPAGQSFDELLASISLSLPDQGAVPPLLISATASTKFGTIRTVARSGAAAGISRFLFLVKSDSKGTGIIRFEAPKMGDSIPDIEPFFIQIDGTGNVFTGSGPSRTRMDGGPEDGDLEKLDDTLEIFAAAAKSAGYGEAPCQIFVNPNASYQRMIDVLSIITKWELKPHFTDMEAEPRPKRIMPAPRKPTAPYRSQPLPLAPPKEDF